MLQENGDQEDGPVPGLKRVPGTGHKVRVPGFTQERIQERSIVKWKQVYLERYTFYRQNAISLSESKPWHLGLLVLMG